jgi:hypothetical protein
MKRILVLLLGLAATSAFAQTKISELPAAGALVGTEEVPAVQGGTTVKTTPAAVATYVKTTGAVMWPLAIWLAIVGVVILAFVRVTRAMPEPPKVKTHDAIDEEIRRERIELHNTSLAYADMQGEKDARVCAKLAAAFRSGAQWQQRQN